MPAGFLIAYEVLRTDENDNPMHRVFVYKHNREMSDSPSEPGAVSMLIGGTYNHCVFSVDGLCVWSNEPVMRLSSSDVRRVNFPDDGDLPAWKLFCRDLYAMLMAGCMPKAETDAKQRFIEVVFPATKALSFRSLLTTVDKTLAKLIH